MLLTVCQQLYNRQALCVFSCGGLLVFSWPSLMRSLMVYRSIFPSELQYVFHSLYKTIAGPPAAAAAQINSQHVKVAAVKPEPYSQGVFFPPPLFCQWLFCKIVAATVSEG